MSTALRNDIDVRSVAHATLLCKVFFSGDEKYFLRRAASVDHLDNAQVGSDRPLGSDAFSTTRDSRARNQHPGGGINHAGKKVGRVWRLGVVAATVLVG